MSPAVRVAGFTHVDRDGIDCWLHESAPVWITRYEPVRGVRKHSVFYAYRAVARVPKGCMPWTVNNKRLGDVDEPFTSLDAAAAAAREAADAIAQSEAA